MDYAQSEDKIFVRFERGEEVIRNLKELREDSNIENGFFQAIGAVDEVKIGHYDVGNQQYNEKEFNQDFEVPNFAGNIGPDKIHAHITVADEDLNTKAGHCSKAVVSGTFEMIIHLSEKPVLKHRYEEKTGLDVFDL